MSYSNDSYDDFFKKYVGIKNHVNENNRFYFKVKIGKTIWSVDAVGSNLNSCKRRVVISIFDTPLNRVNAISIDNRLEDVYQENKSKVTSCTKSYFNKHKNKQE